MDRDLGRLTCSTTDEASPDEKRAAALYVASVAHDKDDATHLLAVLGLLPKRLTVEHGLPGYKAGCRCKTCRKANSNRINRQRRATSTDCPINTTTRGTQ
jgi:hypothetical protein